MNGPVGIGEVARALLEPISRFGCREAIGRLVPELTLGDPPLPHNRTSPAGFPGARRIRTARLAHVLQSSNDGDADAERQEKAPETRCASRGWTFELIAEPGSGKNARTNWLVRLPATMIDGDDGRHQTRFST